MNCPKYSIFVDEIINTALDNNTMIYNTKDSNEVFWAAIDGFRNGRDPLGIENSSVALYSLLVPGLTNLTGRVRY